MANSLTPRSKYSPSSSGTLSNTDGTGVTHSQLHVQVENDLEEIRSEVVTETGAQTLTQKTLTSPTITSPTISSPSVTGGTYSSPTLTTPTLSAPVFSGYTLGTNAGGAGSVKIAETVISTATTGITFSSIPQTYRHLRLIWMARLNTGAELAAGLRFNGDTAANYQSQVIDASGTTTANSESLSLSYVNIGSIAGATSGAGMYNMGEIRIPFYSQTSSHKIALCNSFRRHAATTGQMHVEIRYAVWSSTAAVSTILFGDSTFAVAFATGTIATLYGEL